MAWLFYPSSNSAPAPACSADPSSSPANCSDSEPTLWVYVSSTLEQRGRSWRGWSRRGVAFRLFGTMRKASSGDASVDWNRWMSSVRATRASHSVAPGNVLARAMKDTFGRRCVGALQDSSPASCGWRTWTRMSLSARARCCGICEDLDTALRQDCTRRRKWGRRIFADGCSFLESWTTPQAHDPHKRGAGQTIENNGAGNACLNRDATTWPTPATGNAGGNKYQVDRNGNVAQTLTGEVNTWPTPTALAGTQRGAFKTHTKQGRELMTDAVNWATPNTARRGAENPEKHQARASANGAGCKELVTEIQNWPTPNANPEAPNNSKTRENGRIANRSTDQCMATIAENWPTASARDHHNPQASIATMDRNARPLNEHAFHWTSESSLPAAPTGDDGLNSLLLVWTRPQCPRLSPAFQWWLMGWPHPQTFFGSAATVSVPCKPPGHSSTCSPASWSQWRQQNRSALYSLLCAAMESEA